MSDLLWVLAIGVGAYLIAGAVMQNQQQQAIASCGSGPIIEGSTAAGSFTSCPALAAVQARWAWYPEFKLSL